MTAKQAYEVFFQTAPTDLTDEEIKNKISEKELKKIYYELMLKYHPDAHIRNEQEQKEAVIISKEINNAYEIMRYILKLPGANYPPGKYENLLFLKKQQEETVNRSRLKHEYLDAINNILNIYIYEKINELSKYIDETLKKITPHLSVPKLLEVVSEYEKYNDTSEQELAKIKKQYEKLSAMIKSENLSKSVLEELLKEFAVSYYEKLTDQEYLHQVKKWHQEKCAKVLEELETSASVIPNVESKVIARFTTARDIYQTKQRMYAVTVIKNSLGTSKNISNLGERLLYLAKAMKEVTNYKQKITVCQKKWESCLRQIQGFDFKHCKIEDIAFFEDLIEDLLTKDYLELLSDQEKYHTFMNFYKGIISLYDKDEDELAKAFITCKDDLINKIITSQKETRLLKSKMNLPQEHMPLFKNSSFDRKTIHELLSIDKYTAKELMRCQKKMLLNYYEYLISYFASIRDMSSLIKHVQIYENYLSNSNDPDNVNECFKILKLMFDTCNGNDNDTFRLSQGARNFSKQLLINEIQEIYWQTFPSGSIAPDDISKIYEDRYSLDIITLAKLYFDLANLHGNQPKKNFYVTK